MAECSGILHHPGWAPVILMLFPPPLGTGCCRSYLGQLQPPSSGGRAPHTFGRVAAPTLINAEHQSLYGPDSCRSHTSEGWPTARMSEGVCAHIIYKPLQLDFINIPFWCGKGLTSPDMISHCQLDNVGVMCIFPFWCNVIYDWLATLLLHFLFISDSKQTKDTWENNPI